MTTNKAQALTVTEILKNEAEALGYVVGIYDGEIDYVMPANRNSYTPELTSPSKFKEDTGWTIQTTSYGAKTTDEISQVIEGLQNAQKMVKLLEVMGALLTK